MHRRSQTVSSLSNGDAGPSRARMRSSQAPSGLGGGVASRHGERSAGEGRLARLPGLSEERAGLHAPGRDREQPITKTGAGLKRASSTRRVDECARPASSGSGLARSSTVTARIGETGRTRDASNSSVETAIFRGPSGRASAERAYREGAPRMQGSTALVAPTSPIRTEGEVLSQDPLLRTTSSTSTAPTPASPRKPTSTESSIAQEATPKRSRSRRTEGEATPRSKRDDARRSARGSERRAGRMAEDPADGIERSLYTLTSPRSTHRTRMEALKTLEGEMMGLFPKTRTVGGTALDGFLARNAHRPLLQLVASQATLILSRSRREGSQAAEQAMEQLTRALQLLQGVCMVDWRGAHGCAGDIGQGWFIETLLDLLESLADNPALAERTDTSPADRSPAVLPSTSPSQLQVTIIELLMPILLASPTHARRFERAGGLDTLAGVIQAVKAGVSPGQDRRAMEERDRLTMKCGEILYYWTHYRWMLLADEEGPDPSGGAPKRAGPEQRAAPLATPRRSAHSRQSSSASSVVSSSGSAGSLRTGFEELTARPVVSPAPDQARPGEHRRQISTDSNHSRTSSRDINFARPASVSRGSGGDVSPATPRKDRQSFGPSGMPSSRSSLELDRRTSTSSTSSGSVGLESLPSTPRKQLRDGPSTPARRPPSGLSSSASMQDVTGQDVSTPGHRSKRSHDGTIHEDVPPASPAREMRRDGLGHVRRESLLRDPRRASFVLDPLEEEPQQIALGRTSDSFGRDIDTSMHSTLRSDQVSTPERSRATADRVSAGSGSAQTPAPPSTPSKTPQPPRPRMSFGALASGLGLGLPGVPSPARPTSAAASGLSKSAMMRKASPLMQRADDNGATPVLDSGLSRGKFSGMKKSATSGGLSSMI